MLLSKSLSKRVRLVETTALNPRLAAAPVARFLSDVGHAGRVYPAPFAWPDAENAQYRPRFRYGRIVLGLATWNFTKDALERSGLAASAHAAIVPLPKYVALVDRDQRLLIDTTTDVGQDIVREQVKKMISEVVTFEESMLNFPHGWLQGTQGSYHAEFTIGIRPRSPHRGDSKGFRFTGELVGGCARSRDDWLYASVFEPAHRFDFLLRAVFDVAFAFAAERNIACFFVRYNDPESQLRLRFQVEAGSELAAELTRLLRTQQTAHGIRRMSFEQYQPETERYGGDASLRECEKIFAVSSALALAAITTPLRDERVHAGARDFAALVSLLVPNERLADVIEALRPPPGERHLDEKDRGSLRRLRSEWPATLSAAEWKALDLSQIWAVLSRANRPMGEVLAAIIHMHANRLGLSKREERRMKTLLWQFLFGRIQEPHK